MTDIHLQWIEKNTDLPLPRQMTEGASGFDIHAAVKEPITIKPGERALIPTGFSLALPDNWEAQVRPRSGLALRFGITTLNAPGTIDADYRGEVKVLLINHGTEPFLIERGERIAQLVFQEVPKVTLLKVDKLNDSVRGEQGFGHTGK